MYGPGTRILVVDDMITMRKQLVRILGEIGFTDILEAEDGIKALETLQNAKPPIGLVISDHEMPHASGLDLFKRIHGDTRFHQLPFILMLLEAEKETEAEAAKAGVSVFITKPFTTETLKQKLEELRKKLG